MSVQMIGQPKGRSLLVICLSTAHSSLLPDWNSTGIASQALFDADIRTCIDIGLVLSSVENFRLDMFIAERIDDGIITVYFNQTVQCEEQQVSWNIPQVTKSASV